MNKHVFIIILFQFYDGLSAVIEHKIVEYKNTVYTVKNNTCIFMKGINYKMHKTIQKK